MSVYGFIGLGLIGGSIARAIREKQPDACLIAYDINFSAVEEALSEHVVDEHALSIGESFRSCDVIFLCAPVQKNDENLREVARFMKSDALITDVGSVKTPIFEAIEAAGLNENFVGGHPMAGSERVGFAASKASLLQNAYYILTPAPETPAEKLEFMKNLVTDLDAIPLILSPSEHDYVVAGISHLPHVVAYTLVNLVKAKDNEDGIMKLVAAGGFKDITRIASSSASMWEQICLTNSENILPLLRSYIDSLREMEEKIAGGDEKSLLEEFEQARVYRDSFVAAGSGPIKISYAITVDIADEPGALAAIATILALAGISIKNIGILHNREYLGGDLRIEFYDEESVTRGKSILESKGYTVHHK
jgi:prephenate dehydrogenase